MKKRPGYHLAYCSVEISGRCNLRCSVCPHRTRDSDMNRDMSLELVDKIIMDLDEIPKRKSFDVTLNQFGESTLNPNFLEILDRFGKKNWGLRFNTNLSAMNVDISKKIVDLGKSGKFDCGFFDSSKCILSLYGYDRQSFQQHTGKDLFDKCLENCRTFVDIYRSEESRFPARIQLVTTALNSGTEIRKRFKELFPDLPSEIRIRFRKAGDWCKTVDPDFLIVRSNSKGRERICSKLSYEMCIFSNGDVSYCCRNCLHEGVIGNVLNNSLREIWHGEIVEEYRNYWFGGEKNLVPLCKDCNYVWK